MKKVILFVLAIIIIAVSAVNVNYSLTKDSSPEGLNLNKVETLAQGEDPGGCNHTPGFVMVVISVRNSETGELLYDIWCCWPSIPANACDFAYEDWICAWM